MYKKYWCLVLVLIICFAMFIYYHALSQNKPQIVFPNGKSFDFGFVNEGEFVKHKFLFENHGRADLEIGNIKTGCGCTNAQVLTKIVKPGESSKLIVEYKGRPVFNREILPVWIQCNDPQSPVIQLILTGKVRTKIFWFPKSVSFHCKQDLLAQQQREVQFLSRNADKFEVLDIFPSSKQILVFCEKNKEGIQCKMRPDVTFPIGNSSEKINVKFQIDDEIKTVDIPVHLMIH